MDKHRYPGVKPFSVSESNLFFGRERDIDRLFKLVNVKPVVVLYSKSGLGKSSLINAGLLPKINAETQYNPVIVRFGSYRETQSFFSPLKALKKKLSSDAKGPALLEKLAVPDFSLWYHLKCNQLKSDTPGITLFVFDQFEELFTYPSVQILEFKKALSEALYSTLPNYYQSALEEGFKQNHQLLSGEELELLYKPLRLKILIAIRSDRLSYIDQLKDYIPDILTNTYQLSALTREQAKEAIVSPANLEDPEVTSPAFSYSGEAVDKILNFLTKGENQNIESFQLQILCQYIEETIVIEQKKEYIEYQDVGDLENIFEVYYDKLISRLPEEIRLNVRKLLEEGLIFEEEELRLSLVEPQILQEYGISKNQLRQLIDTHIIRAEPHTAGGYTYELSHDSLVKPILRAYHKRRMQEERRLEEMRHQEEYEAYKIKVRQKARKYQLIGAAVVLCSILIAVFVILSENLSEAKREVRRMEFLATTTPWYRDFVNNITMEEAQKNIFVRDPEESITLRNEALDIGRRYANDLQESKLSDNPSLLALYLAYHAFAEIQNEQEILAIQLAREAVKHDDNRITNAVLNEILAMTNFHLQSFEVQKDNLLALGFKNDSELIKVTPFGIEVISITGRESVSGRQQTQRTGIESVTAGNNRSIFEFGEGMKHFAAISREGMSVLAVDTTMKKIDQWMFRENTFTREEKVSADHWPVEFAQISALALSGNGQYAALGQRNGSVNVIDLINKIFVPIDIDELTDAQSVISRLEFSPADQQLVIYTHHSMAAVYDLARQSETIIMSQGEAIHSITFSNGAGHVITASSRTASICRTGSRCTGNYRTTFHHDNNIEFATSTPDGRFVITEDTDGRFHVWDTDRNQKPVKQLDIYLQTISSGTSNITRGRNIAQKVSVTMPSVIFSGSGNMLLTTKANVNNVVIWEMPYVLNQGLSINDDESFFARYNISELNDEQKIIYNIQFFGENIDELLALARDYYNSGEYKNARKVYHKLLEFSHDDETHIELFNELGNSYYAVGEYQNAILYYENALEKDPENTRTLGNLGLVYFDLNDFERSFEYHNKALDIDSLYTTSLNDIGNIYHSRAQYSQAVPYYAKAVEADPEYIFGWYNLGVSQYYLNNYDAAFESLTRVSQIDPKYDITWAWNQLGNGYYEATDYDKAYECYQNALVISPGYQWAYYNIGNVEFMRQNYYNSYVNYKKALDIDPQYSDALLRMTDAYENGITTNPRFSEDIEDSNWNMYLRGKIHVRNDRLASAFQDYSELSARNFDYPTPDDWNELASAGFYSKNFQLAVQSQEKAVISNPDDTDYLWNLSWYYLFTKEFRKAIETSKKVISLDPTQTGVYTNLALGYLFDNQYAEAERIYREWMNEDYLFNIEFSTFREVFLKDLTELEEAGITHADVNRIRSLLNNLADTRN